jgi:G:T/U-mismatch repair DNA glycosylase
VFCGTAPGTVSAQRKQYYAHPQNKFWRALHDVGLTPRLLQPSEYETLLTYRIGLTDIAKHVSGMDNQLPRGSLGKEAIADLRARIEKYKPRILAFTSLARADASLQVPTPISAANPSPSAKRKCGYSPRRPRPRIGTGRKTKKSGALWRRKSANSDDRVFAPRFALGSGRHFSRSAMPDTKPILLLPERVWTASEDALRVGRCWLRAIASRLRDLRIASTRHRMPSASNCRARRCCPD